MKHWRPLDLKALSEDTQKVYDVLNHEPDMPCVLIGTSYVAELLATLLKEHFIASSVVDRILDPQRGAIGGLATRADVAYCMGLIKKSAYQDLMKIAEIRNLFAHKHLALDFGDSTVREACEALESWKMLLLGEDENVPDDVTSDELRARARNQFKISVALLAQRIHVDALSRKREKETKAPA